MRKLRFDIFSMAAELKKYITKTRIGRFMKYVFVQWSVCISNYLQFDRAFLTPFLKKTAWVKNQSKRLF